MTQDQDASIAIAATSPREPVFVPKVLTPAVATALGACAAVNGALLVAQARQYGVVTGSVAAVRAEMWVGNLTGIRTLAMFVTALIFLRWLWQMRVNAEALRPDGHRMGRGWTTGSWLIPIANFILPKRIINDIWAASCPADRVRRTSVLLTSWWLLFVAGQIYAESGTQDYRDAEGAQEVRAALRDSMVGTGLYAVAAVLAVAVVLRLARMQRERLAGK